MKRLALIALLTGLGVSLGVAEVMARGGGGGGGGGGHSGHGGSSGGYARSPGNHRSGYATGSSRRSVSIKQPIGGWYESRRSVSIKQPIGGWYESRRPVRPFVGGSVRPVSSTRPGVVTSRAPTMSSGALWSSKSPNLANPLLGNGSPHHSWVGSKIPPKKSHKHHGHKWHVHVPPCEGDDSCSSEGDCQENAGEEALFGMEILDMEDGPALDRGMKVGDIIMALNGMATPDFDSLRAALEQCGSRAAVDFINVENGRLERITLYPEDTCLGVTAEQVRVE